MRHCRLQKVKFGSILIANKMEPSVNYVIKMLQVRVATLQTLQPIYAVFTRLKSQHPSVAGKSHSTLYVETTEHAIGAI